MSKMSNEAVVEVVDSEGLGYFVHYYVSPEEIADPTMQLLVRNAKDALLALEEKIDEEREKLNRD